MQKWIVLYVRGGRVASVENTQENKAELARQFCLSLISVSPDGHEYYNVLGIRKVKP